VFSIPRRKEAGRWPERWPSKRDSHRGKHCYCCWFGQKWPLNCIKNDSRIFEHPQDCSSSEFERGFGKEKVVSMFCSTLLDNWAKGRLSHMSPRHITMADANKNFLTKLLWEMRRGVLPKTLKHSDRVLNGLVRHPLGQRNWNSKGHASRPYWKFFSTLEV